MDIYIINCETSADRREFMRQQLNALSLTAQFINAVVVADIDDATTKKHRYDWVREMTKTEIALYYSHKKCWQKVAAAGKPALILEDDAALSKNLPAALQNLQTLAGADLVNLEVFNCKKYLGKTAQKLDHNHNLFPLYISKAGSAACVLYPSGAQKLLAAEKTGIAISDAYIYKPGRLTALQMEPAGAIQTSVFSAHAGMPSPPQLLNTQTNRAPSKNLLLKCKRLTGEIGLLLYKLRHGLNMKKRPVSVNANDFSV